MNVYVSPNMYGFHDMKPIYLSHYIMLDNMTKIHKIQTQK